MSYTYTFVWAVNPFLQLVHKYDDAVAILRNNHWTQDPTKSVWQNPNQTQFVNESHLRSDPKGAISSIGLDWDSEMRSINTAWGGSPSKYKGNPSHVPVQIDMNGYISPRQGFISYDDEGIDGDGWRMYNPPKKECSHDWAKYTGFNESYEFCKKCDKKKNA